MDDDQILRSMVRDDAYRVVRVLSDGPSGRTELVTLDGEGPLVRKSIPASLANAAAWAVAMEADEPLLPRVESLYRMPDRLVVVYRYVPGESLEQIVAREGPISQERAAEVVMDVCGAVSALHERGVIHRDITPGNVILARDGAHLVDLGIARQRIEGRSRDTTQLGTWGFAAPEQYGFAQTDARSDVYSLGRLLGYLLVGALPGSAAYDRALSDSTLVNGRLAEVVRVTTQFEPSARHQSAAEFHARLEEASAALSAGAALPVEGATPDSSAGDIGSVATRPIDWVSGSELPAGSQSPAGTVARALASGPHSRRLRDVPVLGLLLCLAVCALCGGWILLVATASLLSLTTGKPPWGMPEYCLGLIMNVDAAVLAFDSYCMARRVGPYAHEPSRGSLFARRLTLLLACSLFAFFLVVLVATVMSG